MSYCVIRYNTSKRCIAVFVAYVSYCVIRYNTLSGASQYCSVVRLIVQCTYLSTYILLYYETASATAINMTTSC